MTEKSLINVLTEIQRAQLQQSFIELEHSAHEAALAETLFLLDPRARELFQKQLEIERSKVQKQRDRLQELLLSSDGKISNRPN